MSQRRSVFARLWGLLGIATARDAATRAGRVREILAKHEEQVAGLKTSVAKLEQRVAAAGGQASLLARARKEDLASLDVVSRLEEELEQERGAIEAHVEGAMARAVVSADPFPHAVSRQHPARLDDVAWPARRGPYGTGRAEVARAIHLPVPVGDGQRHPAPHQGK